MSRQEVLPRNAQERQSCTSARRQRRNIAGVAKNMTPSNSVQYLPTVSGNLAAGLIFR